MQASTTAHSAPDADRARSAPLVRRLGRAAYEPTWRAMQRFTDTRGAQTPDEIWFLEHPPVFTLGLAGRREHLLAPGDIPVVASDRGGQVTYHGPGQLVTYVLIDLRRRGLGVRELVTTLERAVVAYTRALGIECWARRDAPGVYSERGKLASVGLRIRRGASYHGIALNVAMDLEPFGRIDPCGYKGLKMTQLASLGGPQSVDEALDGLEPRMLEALAAA
ncbi:MAG TPA: lipoyl(octanoyl) transferase LipB [Steroidobacteraceae bacterium]|nr:lipoyl(octanoyl) transferase LipB [Steroidobacteraceae bacterium]